MPDAEPIRKLVDVMVQADEDEEDATYGRVLEIAEIARAFGVTVEELDALPAIVRQRVNEAFLRTLEDQAVFVAAGLHRELALGDDVVVVFDFSPRGDISTLPRLRSAQSPVPLPTMPSDSRTCSG